MLDKDLAIFYHTETRKLKQAVNRNANRFPEDFMFKLTEADMEALVSQSVIPSKSYFGGAVPYYRPRPFYDYRPKNGVSFRGKPERCRQKMVCVFQTGNGRRRDFGEAGRKNKLKRIR